MTPDNLDKLRKRIREIDSKILDLTAERMNICRDIGRHKREQKLPVKDYMVEKVILERVREQADTLNIIPELAESLIKQLIKYSVIEQEDIKSSSMSLSQNSANKNVFIVGGAGNMGRWMTQFFESLGYSVRIFDVKPSNNLDYDREPNMEHGLQWADILVLAVPMEKTNDLLLDIAKQGYDGVLIEITSLKSPVMTGLEACWQAGIHATAIHPMFGPDVKILAGHNIILCTDERCPLETFQQVENIFKLTSANIIHLPLQDHDKYMSYVLGSAHLVNLLYAQVLEHSTLPLGELENLAGTTFAKQIEVTKDVVAENQNLYFDIQFLNQRTQDLLEVLENVLQGIKMQILNRQRGQFKDAMEKAKNYFLS